MCLHYLVTETLSVAEISEDNAQGWKIEMIAKNRILTLTAVETGVYSINNSASKNHVIP